MRTALASYEEERPLNTERLDGEWKQWYETAHRFEHKVPLQDRGDIIDSIILELALARQRDGDKPFSEALRYRIASFVVADYWRKEKHKPAILSLDNEADNRDNLLNIRDTIADDKALDLDAWVNAKTFLLGCPQRLLQIAYKRTNDITLEPKEQEYLRRFRQREQQKLFQPCVFTPA